MTFYPLCIIHPSIIQNNVSFPGFLSSLGHGASPEQVKVWLPSKQVLLLRGAAAPHDGAHERLPHAPRAPGGQAGGNDDPPRERQPCDPHSRKHAGRHTIGDAR